MAEEKIEQPDDSLDIDTMDTFRYVLHAVKGISPVSEVAELALYDEESV